MLAHSGEAEDHEILQACRQCTDELEETLQSHACPDITDDHFNDDGGYEAPEPQYDSPSSHAVAEQIYRGKRQTKRLIIMLVSPQCGSCFLLAPIRA